MYGYDSGMSAKKDWTGVRVGMLTFTSYVGKSGKNAVWNATCECGNVVVRDPSKLSSTYSKLQKPANCGCKNKNDWTGKKFGMLTFVRPTDKKAGKTIIWELVCDCGKVVENNPSKVIAPHDKPISCGCSRGNDLTGMKVHKLTFLEPVGENIHRSIVWRVACDCGTIKEVVPQSVFRKKDPTMSCGCVKKARDNAIHPRTRSAKLVYRNYDDGDISLEKFMELSQLQCMYCGTPPVKTFNIAKSKPTSSNQLENGNFTYNGLDRVDNTRGHTLDNVVPCCYQCNQAKSNRTLEEFEENMRRLCAHMFNVVIPV